MTPKITPELRNALNQGPGPVPVEDDESKQTYYIVGPTYLKDADFLALQRGLADADAGRTSSIADVRARLEALLRERSTK